MLNTQSYQINY